MMTLREKIIFLLALEWAHSEQRAAPEITIQEVKVKLGEQLLKNVSVASDKERAWFKSSWDGIAQEVTKDIEKAAKGYKRKIIGIDVVRRPLRGNR